MPAYHEAFLNGEVVRVANESTLRAFQERWRGYHHNIQESQIAYAGKVCEVLAISYYHGGDCLYELDHWVLDEPGTINPFPKSHREILPGYWHEPCLTESRYNDWEAQLPLASDVYAVVAEVRQNQPVIVVLSHTGIECLVARHTNNERKAKVMNEVASVRNARAFERRYAFDGIMYDARHT